MSSELPIAGRRLDPQPPATGSLYAPLLLFFSGAAGLGYELVWVRQFSTGLGHEAAGVLAVLAAFFGGMALGAWAVDHPLNRTLRPGLWYAVLELVIGAWGLISIVLVPWVNDRGAELIGAYAGPARQWAFAFLLPLLALLPATAGLGATLPVLERVMACSRRDTTSVAALYAANTLGAVAGTLATTFMVAPRLGFRRTLLLLAGVSLACGVAMLILDHRKAAGGLDSVRVRDRKALGRLHATTLFSAGLLGIGYEVLVVRVMSQALENTVFTFASVLSVYLLATAAGAAAYHAFGRGARWRSLRGWLLMGTTVVCLLGIPVLARAAAVYETVRARLEPGLLGALAGEMSLALLVFLLPAALMAALLSHLLRATQQAGGGLGQALAANMLGAALAPSLFGVVLLPMAGARDSLLLLSMGYLLLLPAAPTRRQVAVMLSACLPLLFMLPPHLRLVQPPPGGRTLAYRQGALAAVAVVADLRGVRYLKVDDRFYMGSTAGAFGERRLAHIPLLLHPRPRRALFLGVGTGITFGAATAHPELTAEGVELVPEVLELLAFFGDANADLHVQPLFRTRAADARRFVRAATDRYDVIVADLFHPARDGAAALYTREHFLAIRARLREGGLFCQWLPLHQLDDALLRTILRSFLEVFPECRAFLAHFNVVTPALGLIGMESPRSYPHDWYAQRAGPRLLPALAREGLGEALALFGTFVGERRALSEFARGAPVHTDDRPLVLFHAPRLVYGPPMASWELLQRVLAVVPRNPEGLIGSADDRGFRAALDAYLQAREHYLNGEILDHQGRSRQSLEELLESVRVSPDFRIGYVRLLQAAIKLSATDREGARRLLLSLQAADPARREAADLVRSLDQEVPRRTLSR